MAKIFTAPFAQTLKCATTASTQACIIGSADAPTNAMLLVSTSLEDVIVTGISAIPRGTVSATSLLLFISGDGGTTKRLIDSALMPAYSLQASTANPRADFVKYSEMTPLRMSAGDSLYVGAGVASASGIVFKAEYTIF